MDRTPYGLIKDATKAYGPCLEISPVYSGDWAKVFKVTLPNDMVMAAKVPGAGHQHLAVAEGEMLQYLYQKAPGLFPNVKVLSDQLLVLSFIQNDGEKGSGGERQAGLKLAQLHSITATQFGFDCETVLGPCPQPNDQTDNWVDFFRDQRLIYMAGVAHDAGKIGSDLVHRIEKFCGRLGDFLPTSPTPVLLHGDFWGGNVLFNNGKCAAFLDPAIYYGHREVDLAFATLFGSFGDDFFEGYRETHKIEDGFFDQRLNVYNLWPLLFHAYWFGGHYVGSVDASLKRLGF